MVSTVERSIETAWLLDFYGALLTEKQRVLLDLHCNYDLSLSELAQQENVSRQGIRDVLVRGEVQLRECEEKLGLLAKSRARIDVLSRLLRVVAALPVAQCGAENKEKAIALIEEMLHVEEARYGV